jgi:hypothetical protein
MGDGFCTEVDGVVGQAKVTLSASQAIGDALSTRLAQLIVGTPGFGNTAAAPEVDTAHRNALTALGDAVEYLMSVCETDTDGLYRTASNYQRVDDENQRRIEAHRAASGGPS